MVRNIGATVSQFTPSLSLDFTKGVLPSGLTFTRATQGTYFDSAGVMQIAAINVPRFDYDPTTLQMRGLLIEEQRTNLILQSGDISHSSWNKSQGGTVVAVPGPAGQTAYQWTAGSAAGAGLQQSYTAPASGVVVMSAWLRVPAGSRTLRFNPNLDTGTDVTVTTVWQRYSYSITVTPNTSCSIRLDRSIVTGQAIEVWGIQMEAGAFPTSYIPTTTAAVTRSADVCNSSIGSWFNKQEGTLLGESLNFYNGNGNLQIVSIGSDQGDLIALRIRTTDIIGMFRDPLGGTGDVAALPHVTGVPRRNVFAYNAGGNTRIQNGSTSVSGGVWQAALADSYTRLGVGGSPESGSPQNGYIRKVIYYPRRLSNSLFQSLTV